MQPILGRTWLEWIRLSRIFRAPFANLSLEIVKKKRSRYYLLSGLSRIFRKPFANVYISRKVPFRQASQIYACGPRLYKTFHGFLHDSHICGRAGTFRDHVDNIPVYTCNEHLYGLQCRFKTQLPLFREILLSAVQTFTWSPTTNVRCLDAL